MNAMPQLFDACIDPSAAAPIYRVVLSIAGEERAEEQLREVIHRKRGDLRSLCSADPRHAGRMQVHLGLRRIDDVLAALEGAGFAVDTVVATTEPPPSRWPESGPSSARVKPRSSNL
jgi:hypothetical protein